MNRADGLVQRRNVPREGSDGALKDAPDVEDKRSVDHDDDPEDGDSKETRLTLMEEVLLLGLKDKEVSSALMSTYMSWIDLIFKFCI